MDGNEFIMKERTRGGECGVLETEARDSGLPNMTLTRRRERRMREREDNVSRSGQGDREDCAAVALGKTTRLGKASFFLFP